MGRNTGKIFEDDFKNSVPEFCWYKRLNDNASSFAGGANTRFTSANECDCLLFNDNTKRLYALELKSTQGSLTFYRKDFVESHKQQSFNIKRNQIEGLLEWSKHDIVCGLVFNFRHEGRTFFVSISDFSDYISKLNKKSINIDDVLKMNCVEITSTKKRTRYRYDIAQFLNDVK